MKNLLELDRYRLRGQAVVSLWGFDGDETCGAFNVPSPTDHAPLVIVASSGGGWDHVSVSRRNRTLNWAEMEHVMKLFAKENETWVQYHVPASEHINVHENCLHWFRPQAEALPRPPHVFV